MGLQLGRGFDGAVQLRESGVEQLRQLRSRQRGGLPERGKPLPEAGDLALGLRETAGVLHFSAPSAREAHGRRPPPEQ